MEALDTAARQSVGLPSINHLDSDRGKREEMDYQRKHSASTMVSPLHSFSGQTFSHSNHQSSPASALPGSLGGLLSPPESRRTSDNEQEPTRAPARQSLPSIHEALGSEQPLSFSAPAPPLSAPVSAPQPYVPPSNATTSPSDQRARAFSSDLHGSQGPPNPFSHPRSPYMSTPTSTSVPPPVAAAPPPPPPPTQVQPDSLPRPSFSEPRPSFSDPRTSFSAPTSNPKLPALHPLRTTQSPPPGSSRSNLPYASYPPQPPTTYETAAPHSAGPMNNQYSYPPYASNYPLSAPPPSGPNSAYPPSATTYSAPPRYPPPAWRDSSEIARLEEKKMNHTNLVSFGDNIKRHLESFDLVSSLNEIAEGAGCLTEFSKIYRQRAHENQRIGMTPQSMPRLEEVDEMLKQSESMQVSLQRMRQVVFNHQQASMVEPPQEARYRPLNGYDHEGPNNFAEDAKANGGFAGADNKTRKRGPVKRAAPPGRCHSCNRAETPEWRRGPDGARTLCNACGLHYAKLTRKMGGKQAMTSSSLRPKSLDQGSSAV